MTEDSLVPAQTGAPGAEARLVGAAPALADAFGRRITYLRLSVTDRCDFRCVYCMSEEMKFAPRRDLLTIGELYEVAAAFIRRGVRKIRLTGGEPLVRKNVAALLERLGKEVGRGLDELTLTTNGARLADIAGTLVKAGVRRVNVSLDTLRRDRFIEITRRDALDATLAGIDAALASGLEVKINTVALKDQNVDEIPDIIFWAHKRHMDVVLIEVMPLGDTGVRRADQYIPLTAVRESLAARTTLVPDSVSRSHAGPARYVRAVETGGRIGFITPLTDNFCAGCNRVRVTATGRIYMCLGQDDHVDLSAALRAPGGGAQALDEALDRALHAKPLRHDFAIPATAPARGLERHMSATGG